MYKKRKPKIQLLYDTQVKYNQLYTDLKDTLSGKRGSIRSLNNYTNDRITGENI